MKSKDKITQCKYWLLNSMIDRGVYTGSILPNIQDSVDIPPFVSIFSAEEVAVSLMELFDDGCLVSCNSQGMQEELFIPDRAKIELATNTKNARSYSNGFYIFLNKKGGELWELLSKPQWNIYTTVLQEIQPEENSNVYEVVILGKQLSLLKKRVSNFFGDSDPHIYENLLPKMLESEISITSQHRPIYWKDLGELHCAKIKFILVTKRNVDRNELKFHKTNMINIQRTSLKSYWYTHPYNEFHLQAQQKLRE